MPSPIGHSLAGLAIGLAIEPVLPASATTTTRYLSKFALMGALVAAMPDTDLVYSEIHRGVSHSIGASILLMIIAGVVTGWVTGRVQWRWVTGTSKTRFPFPEINHTVKYGYEDERTGLLQDRGELAVQL